MFFLSSYTWFLESCPCTVVLLDFYLIDMKMHEHQEFYLILRVVYWLFWSHFTWHFSFQVFPAERIDDADPSDKVILHVTIVPEFGAFIWHNYLTAIKPDFNSVCENVS